MDAQTQAHAHVAMKSTQVNRRPTTRSIGVQAGGPATEDAGCQTDLELPDVLLHEHMHQRLCSTPCPSVPDHLELEPMDTSIPFRDDPADETYDPALEMSTAHSDVLATSSRKYIVYEECLMKCFKFCRECLRPTKSSLEVTATLVVVTSTCEEGHLHIWHSQPKRRRFAVGNVELAAAILFTGSSPTQSIRLLQSAGIPCFTTRTYFRLQHDILHPAVKTVWQEEQTALLQKLRGTGGGAKLAGDSRSDSPGYSAKYGTYSLLETSMNKIVDVRLVQSNEVASSSHMELEGLKRSLEFLDDGDVMIGELVTDRHPQVRKYLRTQRPGVSHLIDAWHVSKGLKKKLLAASKSKGCDAIALWCESIVNHIYHAVQVGAGDADLAEAVWLSVLNHIKDKHDGHSALYDRCKPGT